jgi:iron complex transport system substrate-binding protein
VLLLIDTSPLIVAGHESFIDELITVAGGRNAAGDLPGAYPVLNREAMLASAADVILLPDDLQVTPDQLLTLFPEWEVLPAIRENNIVRVDADLFMRPGPRVMLGLDTLMRILHPGEQIPRPR